MCTTEQTFAWIGAILVNAAFISIISWGALTQWYIGFAICGIYTVLLFVSARIVDKRSGWDRDNIAEVAPEVDHVQEVGGVEALETDAAIPVEMGSGSHVAALKMDASHLEDTVGLTATALETDVNHLVDVGSTAQVLPSAERRMPVMANFLYGIFTLAFGVTGFFLPMNVLPCDFYRTTEGTWSTDTLTLPGEVQAWASDTNYRYDAATFVHINGEQVNVTLFQGSDGKDYSQTLWSITGSSAPVNFANIQNPTYFTDTNNGWACFAAYNQFSMMVCSNGTSVTTTEESTHNFQNPYDLTVDNDSTLWFKDYPPWSEGQIGTGTLIYSIGNYETMEAELHSTYSTSDSNTNDEVPEQADGKCWTNQVILAIFVSALPTTLSSILIWVKRTAPAMAITSYLGISAVATFIYLAAVGQSLFQFNDFWGWWLSVSGALYTLLLCDLYHFKRMARIPLLWGINFASLSFFGGMIILTGIFRNHGWGWVVFNILAIVPLLVIGLGYNQVFLLVLCAIGWMMTAVKIASAIAAAIGSATALIYFVVLAVSGMAIAGGGWVLNRHQEKVHGVLFGWMERVSLSKKLFSEAEVER